MPVSQTRIRVRYAETDRMGLLHHANYLVYFEQARTELLRQLGLTYKDLEDQGFLLVVTKVEIRYKSPARYDDVLTIRGEKQLQQQKDQERDYHLQERSYGTFARYLRLPFHTDPQQVRAGFKDGVLTLTIPKPEEARQKVHRIPVQANDASAGGQATAEQQASQQQAAE